MDKFSKVLVSVAAASVLVSGLSASKVDFYKMPLQTPNPNGLRTQVDDVANNAINLKTASADQFGAIKVADLLKGAPNLNINAYDTNTWPAASNTARNRLLFYYSDSELPQQSTLSFKVSCGAILKPPTTGPNAGVVNDVYLYAVDTNASGDSAWVKVGHLTDFSTVTIGTNTGYTFLKFTMDSNYEVNNADATGIADHNFTKFDGTKENVDDTQGNIPAGTLLVFATDRNVTQVSGRDALNENNLTRLNILPLKGDKCGCVCDTQIELTEARDKTGVLLSAPKNGTAPATLITYTTGLVAKINDPRVGTPNAPTRSDINATAPVLRKQFWSTGGTVTDFRTTISTVTTNVVQPAPALRTTYPLTSSFRAYFIPVAEYGIALDGNDTMDININRAIDCAVKDVTLWGSPGTSGTVMQKLTKNSSTSAYEITTDFSKLRSDAAGNNYIDFNISVNGTDVICPGMWRISVKGTFNEAGVGSATLFNVENAANWQLIGMRFIVPYLNTDPNYGTYIVVTNKSFKSVPVYMDVIGDGGKNPGMNQAAQYTNIQLGDIPARSTRIYFPKDLNTAIKNRFPAWNANRYLAQFICVTGNNDNIEAAAFQKDGNNGKRSIPVLTARGQHTFGE